MEVKHDESRQEFYVELEGHRAHVSYKIHDEGLDIRHTIVPEAIGGKGIASALVQAAYDYGRCKGLKAIATCSYAVVWLQRHPEYQGEASSDYIGKRVCQNAYPLFFYDKAPTFPSRGFVIT
jgi:predicted GNAT family acetyltransferase